MRLVAVLGLALLSWLTPLHAREIGGVAVPEQVRMHADGTPLTLNGAGIRRKLFTRIYVGALYLPAPARDLPSVLALPGGKRFSMHFVHAETSPETLVDAWKQGFKDNLPPEVFRALRPRIANFNGLFPTLHRGDQVDIDVVPGIGTQVWINGRLRGRVAGDDFARALLGIWLGEKPADVQLKRDLLGGRKPQ